MTEEFDDDEFSNEQVIKEDFSDDDNVFNDYGEGLFNDPEVKSNDEFEKSYDKLFSKRRVQAKSVSTTGNIIYDDVGKPIKTDLSLLNKTVLNKEDLDDLLNENVD